MTIKNITEKVVGILPGFSIFAYTERQLAKPLKERDGKIKWYSKVTGHVAYTIVFTAYLSLGITNGVWDPLQYKQHFEKIKTEITQRKEYKQKLFGVNGYADKDGDGKISSSERFEVYRRAGLEDKIKFPELLAEDLERVVKSYEADTK